MNKLEIIIVINKSNWEMLHDCLVCLSSYCDKYHITVANNGSTFSLTKDDFNQDNVTYLNFGSPVPYGYLLNSLRNSIIEKDSDILLLDPSVRCDESAIINLQQIAYSNHEIGIAFIGKHNRGRVLIPTKGAVYIKKEVIKTITGFNPELITEDAVLLNTALDILSTNGMLPAELYNYATYETFIKGFYRVPENTNIYVKDNTKNIKDAEHDKDMLEKLWGTRYFNTSANFNIVNAIQSPKDASFKVLEIGCDLGATLMEIKKRFPMSRTYGIEINRGAAKVASHVANHVIDDDIESDKMRYFWDQFKDTFDYIIFGDVLEHLRDPETILKKCKGILKDDGHIIASIPNLMHISVIEDLLIKGNFTYTERGLLDKTHIHFFTKNEIVKIFNDTGYKFDKLSSLCTATSNQQNQIIRALTELSGGIVDKSQYSTFQYLCVASKQ